MDDHIKRHAAVSRFEQLKEQAETLRDKMYLDGVMAIIDNLPAANAREDVQGDWISYEKNAFCGFYKNRDPIFRDLTVYNCNKCGRGSAIRENFCPNCGARMVKNNGNKN